MTARAFLIRGLLAGLLAGFAAFLVAFTVGEPQVQAAIALEEASSAAEAPAEESEAGHSHESDEAHSHEDEGAVVSREQPAHLGPADRHASASVRRSAGWSHSSPPQSSAASAAGARASQRPSWRWSASWRSALVPFLKYPASPPAVGNADTIGSRTAEYFASW